MSLSQFVDDYFSSVQPTQSVEDRKNQQVTQLGKVLACQSLRASGFQILDRPQPDNEKYGVVMARHKRRRYVIEVVTRHKRKENGEISARYRFRIKPSKRLARAAAAAEKELPGVSAAWVAVRLEEDGKTFSAFFGTVLDLVAKTAKPGAVLMKETDTKDYRELVRNGNMLKAVREAAAATDQPTAFVSYAHEDDKVARSIAQKLRKKVRHVFFGGTDVKIGDDLEKVIWEKLAQSQFAIPLLTSDYFVSDWSEREFNEICERAAKDLLGLLPVRKNLKEVDAKRQLKKRSPKLSAIVSKDLDEVGEDQVVQELLEAMTA